MKKILGFTEDFNTCDCCGKSGLKGTYAIDFEGTLVYYGSTCAFKKHGITKAELKVADKAYKAVQMYINTARRLGGQVTTYAEALEYRHGLERAAHEAGERWRAEIGAPPLGPLELSKA
jgi:hypothetical protein